MLLEVGAFAGIAEGVIGLTHVLPAYATAAFFPLAVPITYLLVLLRELSPLVNTRSSQAVKKLIDRQPT